MPTKNMLSFFNKLSIVPYLFLPYTYIGVAVVIKSSAFVLTESFLALT